MNREVFDYLDNQMSDVEKLKFQQKVAESETLQRELQEAKAFFATVRSFNEVPDMQDYFAEARVRANEKISKKSKVNWFFKPISLVSMSASFIIIFVVGLLYFHANQPVTLSTELAGIDSEVVLAYAQATPVETEMAISTFEMLPTSDAVLDDAIKAEIGLTTENAEEFLENLHFSTDELVTELTAEDVENLSKRLDN